MAHADPSAPGFLEALAEVPARAAQRSVDPLDLMGIARLPAVAERAIAADARAYVPTLRRFFAPFDCALNVVLDDRGAQHGGAQGCPRGVSRT